MKIAEFLLIANFLASPFFIAHTLPVEVLVFVSHPWLMFGHSQISFQRPFWGCHQ